MNRVSLSAAVLLIAALVLPTHGTAQSPRVLQPTEQCADHSASAIVTFADPDLEEVVRAALGVGAREALTCGKASELTQFSVPSTSERVVYGGTLRPSPPQPFESLEGIQNLRNLTNLTIMNRLVTNVPAIGSTVDVEALTYDNTIGSAELSTVWVDPDFNPDERAFYYVRVLEIPTLRHSTYDAVALGQDPAEATPRPSVIQERALSSPIWYTP